MASEKEWLLLTAERFSREEEQKAEQSLLIKFDFCISDNDSTCVESLSVISLNKRNLRKLERFV